MLGITMPAADHYPGKRRRAPHRLAGPPRQVPGPRHRPGGRTPVMHQPGPRRLWDAADDIRHAWLGDGSLPARGATVTTTAECASAWTAGTGTSRSPQPANPPAGPRRDPGPCAPPPGLTHPG
jgi:hypothetical protein